jgi:hypothetical protein
MYSPSLVVSGIQYNMTNKQQQQVRTPRQNKKKTNKNKRGQANSQLVGVGVPQNMSVMLPPSTYNISSIGNTGQIRIRGRDILGPLKYGGGTSQVFGVFDLNPACWNSSRLSLLAKTYEKYRYDKIRLIYVPSVASSISGMVGIYVEPEIYDNVVTSVANCLTHFAAIAGPAWSPLAVEFNRAPSDQTSYLCTEKPSIERALLSQAKAAVLCDGPITSLGILAIEYDITFMYPELEYGYAGEQYSASSASLTAAAGGIIATNPAWTSGGVKIVEYVLNNQLTGCFVNAVSNLYDYLEGAILYSAYDGTSWRLYPDLASAAAKSGPISSIAAIAAVNYGLWVRKLVASS